MDRNQVFPTNAGIPTSIPAALLRQEGDYIPDYLGDGLWRFEHGSDFCCHVEGPDEDSAWAELRAGHLKDPANFSPMFPPR